MAANRRTLPPANTTAAAESHAVGSGVQDVLRANAEGWANVLELRLIPQQHRATAETLRDRTLAALRTAPAEPDAEPSEALASIEARARKLRETLRDAPLAVRREVSTIANLAHVATGALRTASAEAGALSEAYAVIDELAPEWSGSSLATVLRHFLRCPRGHRWTVPMPTTPTESEDSDGQ